MFSEFGLASPKVVRCLPGDSLRGAGYSVRWPGLLVWAGNIFHLLLLEWTNMIVLASETQNFALRQGLLPNKNLKCYRRWLQKVVEKLCECKGFYLT